LYRKELAFLVRQWESETGGGDLAYQVPLPIALKWHKHPDLGEGLQPIELIRSQDGYHGMAQCFEIAQERSCRAFPVHNHANGWCFPFAVLIESQKRRESHGQMLVTSIRHCQARMPLLIVQEHQRSTPQNFARASN